MEIFCAVIMALAAVISCAAPYLAFWMSVTAFVILFATKMDAKKEQKGLDFGQEWDYDTASKACYSAIFSKERMYELKMERAASRIAEKQRPKVLAKMASGQARVHVFVGRYSENFVFRRYFKKALGCGELEYGGPFFLTVQAKKIVA